MKKIMRSIFCLGRDRDGDRDSSSSSSAFVDIKDKGKCPSFVPENVEAWACTQIEQETFSIFWALNNFSSFTSKKPDEDDFDFNENVTNDVESPVFKCGSQQNGWQLEINPKERVDGLDCLSIFLSLTSFGDGDNSVDRKIKAKFQISLLDGDGIPGKISGDEEVCVFNPDCMKWGYKDFMEIKDLLQNKSLLDNDCLKIHCRIWIKGDLKHETGSGRDRDLGKASKDELNGKLLHGLSGDFGKLLSSSEKADVTIKTPKQTFMAHRMILAARSPVFKQMFEIDMVESKTHSVDIPDFDKEVVQGMLEYMYRGHTQSLFERTSELLQIADKYDLGGLKEVCEIQIANNLTVKNAAEVLVLAHLHNASTLKHAVVSFINRNKVAVKKTKTFQNVAKVKANRDAFVDLYLSQV